MAGGIGWCERTGQLRIEARRIEGINKKSVSGFIRGFVAVAITGPL